MSTNVNEQELDTLDIADLVGLDTIRYDIVKDAYGPGQHARIGSVDSLAMIEWLEGNDSKDEEVKKMSGLRLLARSLVNKDGTRIPEDQLPKYVQILGEKDSLSNGKVIRAALILNGLRKRADELEKVKNDSGEAQPAASPTN